MYTHAQRRLWHKEAGGELFANDPDAAGLVITTATGPNPRDRRSRCSWNPDTETADQDRQQQFVHGRHVLASGTPTQNPFLPPLVETGRQHTTTSMLFTGKESGTSWLPSAIVVTHRT